jgi:hypothetical protein
MSDYSLKVAFEVASGAAAFAEVAEEAWSKFGSYVDETLNGA